MISKHAEGLALRNIKMDLILLYNASNPRYLLKGVLVWHNGLSPRLIWLGNYTRISVLSCFRHQVVIEYIERAWCQNIPLQHTGSNLEWARDVSIHNDSTLEFIVEYTYGIDYDFWNSIVRVVYQTLKTRFSSNTFL